MKDFIHKKDEIPVYLFFQGTNYEAYKFFSPRRYVKNKKAGWIFTVYAKNAKSVRLVGDFNGWDDSKNFMEKISDQGIFRLFVEGLEQFDNYKYAIEDYKGEIVFKADPYALHAETAPSTASKLYDLSGYRWHDKKWLDKRKKTDTYSKPMNIYEVHIGSWRRYDDGNVFSYKEFANQIVAYCKAMHYTHIELLPITEYPYDGSWGYQITGLFAPTSRYGTPSDFMYLVDKCHENNIGVILDWVVSHFPKDKHGLANFDGTPMYEYDEEWMEHKEWGTKVFDYSKPEVQSFLISSAKFWTDVYHIDGLRVDAVASMLYLDYGKKDGEWRANKDGGNYNLDAINFLQNMNRVVLQDGTGVITIAEESTSFPMVTKPNYDGGLGFNYKWNMGWMNDTLNYIETDPFFRKDNHDKLTFSLTYAYSENFILPLSHDEVVHGKKSLIGKNYGDYTQKFESLKALYGYFMTFVGKKLSFMGNEFAQFIEWDYKKGLDWLLLDYPMHAKFQRFVKDLNELYVNSPCLYEQDTNYLGFNWLVVEDKTQNIIAYTRYAKNGDYYVIVINFSPVTRKNYVLGVPDYDEYEVVFSSDKAKYGSVKEGKASYKPRKFKYHNQNQSIKMLIPKNSVTILRRKEGNV